MTASAIIIAGLFDGPWMFIAIVLASAVVNWLSKRREEKMSGGKTPEGAPPPAASSQSPAADWEERLRRLLGEEMVPPAAPQPPRPAPPLHRPKPQTSNRPPIIRPTMRPTAPRRPPPVEVVPVVVTASSDQVSGGGVEKTIARYEQLDPAVMTAVRPITSLRKPSGSGLGAKLRDPHAARQAFVASLVFGPPKGLEG